MKETARNILEALEDEVTPDGAILLARLLDHDPDLEVVPPETFEAARAVFGNSVMSRRGRIASPLRSKIAHALRVWDAKYGPLNQMQLEYADTLLSYTIRNANRYALENNLSHPAPIVWTSLQNIVNHERVDAGFKHRATETADYSEQVSEAISGRRSDG